MVSLTRRYAKVITCSYILQNVRLANLPGSDWRLKRHEELAATGKRLRKLPLQPRFALAAR